ncbi:MAG: hypothetical protein EWV53_22285 [Microcystis panniformis Mp_MB_F_20051200_S9]|uniref:Uncharacterized protein n=1 Tax=Microcystis panniformis Mp_MB_F_20051200_S9 TaxID=2486223 RepID=A0A552PIF4_9CHRO|nr:MAG: hypothetical protein EWV42_24250 [Microcystis panniformis Mp_GB_SS_20050300_S99D]TRV48606.1 MAG: hypothetical protein EWV43_10175 [Microcystis panniformis Mp_MB_F_20080800_S26D]TRV52464.1 MAG: hypothetical protein EWV87_04770 [Microcystis panniformis Mp_GB_SS_20050300_S99]TRV56395.1 MAG: hypothetical protein EWV86_22675 [Microcystis panniformis Mp_MB_F_20051200_S9D]TRV56711.1 MAG: hypothetical protein EWV53_22285 [Microcystis panniformis Mp_MB_F_20051200_S9]TRV57497.1 MAG: hypothetical
MPNNNNQPDINKAIDVCMEEYKTLRTEILQTIQNRTNVIVFGGALVLTLLGIGISPIANLPIMKETTTVTRIPTDITTIEKKTGNTIKQTISHPKADSNHTNQETNSTLVIKEKETETETISRQNFYDIPIERRIPSAIILGIIVPASCILIILLVHGSTYLIVRIGRYIATNIEPKINDLYFNNLPSGQKPIVWESYMQTFKIEAEENNWVTVVFGSIALVANVGGIFSAVNILNNMVFLTILLVPLGIFIFLLWWGWETKKNMVELRDGEGSLRKIWYEGINRQNEDVKSTRIFWIKPIRYFIPLYQIVGEMIDDRTNAIIEIENDSLSSKLQTLGKVDLANQVQNTKVLMQAQGADKQDLLNKLINDLFKNLLNKIKNYSRTTEYNPPFYFNLDKGGGKRINNIPELLELCIDNRNKFKEHMEQGDFENWLDNIEIRETELANIAQATREKNFPNDNERLHYFLRECCLVLIGRNP